jgi:preprotein translocase subunit SecE
MSETKVKKANALVEYFQESFMEMKKVTWPTRNQAVRLTLLVLGFCFGAAIVIGAMDAIFSFGHQKLIDYAASVNPVEYVQTADTSAATVVPVSATTGAEVPVTSTQQ